jgi:hypothetical protein
MARDGPLGSAEDKPLLERPAAPRMGRVPTLCRRERPVLDRIGKNCRHAQAARLDGRKAVREPTGRPGESVHKESIGCDDEKGNRYVARLLQATAPLVARMTQSIFEEPNEKCPQEAANPVPRPGLGLLALASRQVGLGLLASRQVGLGLLASRQVGLGLLASRQVGLGLLASRQAPRIPMW